MIRKVGARLGVMWLGHEVGWLVGGKVGEGLSGQGETE